jgi:glycosyltransferase involved in cell wall biosynthesis
MTRLVYVLPVHNEEKILAANVDRLTAYLVQFPGSEVYLVENGSSDGSWAAARELEARAEEAGYAVPVRAFREERAGIGYAYHRGLTEAVARSTQHTSTWAVLTATDLPFGLSDVEAALVPLARSTSRIFMGSKAHRESKVTNPLKRKAMTAIYRVARRAVVGMRVGDSQGSVFLRLDLAVELLPRIESRGFFYSTELCYFAEQAGEAIVELPIVVEGEQRLSTVRPLRDGLAMAGQLVKLRRRRLD